MIRTLQSSWMTAMVGCLLYLGVTAALIKPLQFPDLPSAGDQAGPKPSGADAPSWKFQNPEFDQWVQEIKREKESLALREQQLRDLQARLESEREELNTATQTVSQLQADFDKNVIRIKDQEVENLKRQAKVISGMSAEGAAGVLNQMPEDDAVRILFTMKVDEASLILETLSKLGKIEARRAALITEKLQHTLPPAGNGRPKASP